MRSWAPMPGAGRTPPGRSVSACTTHAAAARLTSLAAGGGFASMVARLTLERWQRPARRSLSTVLPRRRLPGLRIAQVSLQGRLDAELRGAGAGDGGGLATLLLSLTQALDAHAAVSEVVTFTRAFEDPSLPGVYSISGASRARLAHRTPTVRSLRLSRHGRAVGPQGGHRGGAHALDRPPRAIRRRSPPLRRRRHVRRGAGLPQARRADRVHPRTRSALGSA